MRNDPWYLHPVSMIIAVLAEESGMNHRIKSGGGGGAERDGEPLADVDVHTHSAPHEHDTVLRHP
jgi:hypothetical protein